MRSEQINTLRKLLRDFFQARYEGVAAHKLNRVHGYVDGYMAAMLSSKTVTQRELLEIVSQERAKLAGPAFGTIEPEALALT